MFENLKLHARAAQNRSILSLFDSPERAEEFSLRWGNMLFDYSKTNMDGAARDLLLELFAQAQVDKKRSAMFSGQKINETENRAVLHVALRNKGKGAIYVDGADVMPEVRATRASMVRFCKDVRSGDFRGQGGKITDVVNIGIGGSDLGPAMAVLALAPYHDGPNCHFVSNIDGAHISDVLKALNPETTLVIVASKTFTTIETMTNAATALDWMSKSVKNPAAQFAALSSATEKTAEFGISDDRVFGFSDWVGGRYSLWGPIGLSIMIAIGPDHFDAFLEGAYEMDQHFLNTDPLENMPVMLALTGIWHNQVCGYGSRAVLPYDQRLARLPAYLQQLEMESNGKQVSMDGERLSVRSGPIVWGEPGTNGQHAFYQLLHQGTELVPCEFMVAAQGHEEDLGHHHHLLLANCLAQSQALMVGRAMDDARGLAARKGYEGAELERQAQHRVFEGNRPSTTLLYPKLTPKVLGALIALYEHRVFVEGAILNINSYDQWGVELGKELATALEPILRLGHKDEKLDASTRQLLDFVREHGN